MTELEKIEYAKTFIDKLANGINPLDDTPLPEGDIANNVRLSRCFFYVSEILRQVIANGGTAPVSAPPPKRTAFSLTPDKRETLSVSEMPLSCGDIARYLNAQIDESRVRKISAFVINKWLLAKGFLQVVPTANGKRHKEPTAAGREIGIFTEDRVSAYGPYLAVLFNAQAQQFIYDNIEDITAQNSVKYDPLAPFHNRPWTEEQDARLKELWDQGTPVEDIAFALKRTEPGVCARIVELGLQNEGE